MKLFLQIAFLSLFLVLFSAMGVCAPLGAVAGAEESDAYTSLIEKGQALLSRERGRAALNVFGKAASAATGSGVAAAMGTAEAYFQLEEYKYAAEAATQSMSKIDNNADRIHMLENHRSA